MGRRRNQVGHEGGRFAGRLDPDHLVMHRMPARSLHAHTWHDASILVHELEHARFSQRQIVVSQVARTIARVRMCGVFPFAPPDDVLRPRKARAQLPTRVSCGKAAGMIEMQVGGQDDVDVFCG